MLRLSWFLSPACTLITAVVAHAGGVVIVGRTPIASFSDLQSAVDAAVEGDVLMVGTGHYPGCAIVNKSVSIFAAPGADVLVDGTLAVSSLAASRTVLLVGLRVTAPPTGPVSTAASALLLSGNLGQVRAQSCRLTGAVGSFCGQSLNGGHAVAAVGCRRVAFVACEILGGAGGACPLAPGGHGGDALHAATSVVAAYDCEFRGGEGALGGTGGTGGDGCELLAVELFASGSSFLGGDGGDDAGGCAGPGGDGARVTDSLLRSLDTSFTKGICGSGPPPPFCDPCFGLDAAVDIRPVNSTIVSYPGAARRCSIVPVHDDTLPVTLTVEGEAGDRIHLVSATLPGWLAPSSLAGVWLVPVPKKLSWQPLGIVPASGVLEIELATSDVAVDSGRILFRQVLAIDAGGTAWLASPMHELVLDRHGQPDCNANGVLDYLDAIEGTSPDIDADLVPDECETIPTWFVDDDAPPGGNGSAANPFQSILEGMSAASSGHVVLVLDGIYSGPMNRDLDFAGKDLIVRSQNGPASCIIDGQHAGRAFLVRSDETSVARIQGFTIRNGDASAINSPSGGGIYVDQGARPRISNCVFERCSSNQEGGAVYYPFADIEGCSFVGNSAPAGGALSASPGIVRNCNFDSNFALVQGGAIMTFGAPNDIVLLVACTFVDNVSMMHGGAIHQLCCNGAIVRVEQCLFAGNSASDWGGAISSFDGIAISGCTFAGNAAARGGAVSLARGTVDDSILWNNSASVGAQIAVLSGPVTVGYSDVQGGSAAVHVDPGGTLVWAAGNLDLDPAFADAAFHLLVSSPCIDAGDNFAVPADSADLDGDGDTSEPTPLDRDLLPRFIDVLAVPDTGNGTPPIVDMGCYELQL